MARMNSELHKIMATESLHLYLCKVYESNAVAKSYLAVIYKWRIPRSDNCENVGADCLKFVLAEVLK